MPKTISKLTYATAASIFCAAIFVVHTFYQTNTDTTSWALTTLFSSLLILSFIPTILTNYKQQNHADQSNSLSNTMQSVINLSRANKPLIETLHEIINLLCRNTGARFIYFIPTDSLPGTETAKYIFSLDNNYFDDEAQQSINQELIAFEHSDIIPKKCIAAKNAQIVNHEENLPLHSLLNKFGVNNHLIIPANTKNRTKAFISISYDGNTDTQTYIPMLDSIATHIACLIEYHWENRELQNNIRRLENSQRAANIGSIEWSANERSCLWSNQVYELFGYEPDSFQPSISALIEFAHFADRRRLRAFFDNVKNYTGDCVEYKALHVKGKEIMIRIKTDQDENNGNYNAVIQDITEQHRLSDIKAEFISTVSHELRTPLTAIKGSLSLIDLSSNEDNKVDNIHLVEIARKNIDRLLFLVNDILDIEKANSGELTLNLKKTEINQLIRDASNQMTHYASQFGTTIDLQLFAKDIHVSIDQNRVTQAILNILSNAIKYSPEGSTVTLRTQSNDETMRILISDQGEGIPDDMKDRVFEKFTQITSSHHKKIGGSGLGLSIAKVLIEKHGGRIGFYPNENKGSTFYIELNIIDDPISRLMKSPDNEKMDKKSVLVIEDDLPTSKHLRILLQKLGYNVTNAYSIEQAKDLFEGNSFDLVTVDVMLPDDNGLHFVKNINSKQPNLPVLVISAVADLMKEKEENKNLNVHHWFTKPFNHEDFIQTIKKLAKSESDNQSSHKII